jgi:hypothetical protein
VRRRRERTRRSIPRPVKVASGRGFRVFHLSKYIHTPPLPGDVTDVVSTESDF